MRLSRFPLLCATILLLPVLSFAQDATGRITGTISDPQGAVLPGVRVTVTDSATQVSRTTTTGRDGSYQVLALPIGNYRVTAEQRVFARSLVSPQAAHQSGAAHGHPHGSRRGDQTVDVGAEAAPVETVNPTLGQS